MVPFFSHYPFPLHQECCHQHMSVGLQCHCYHMHHISLKYESIPRSLLMYKPIGVGGLLKHLLLFFPPRPFVLLYMVSLQSVSPLGFSSSWKKAIHFLVSGGGEDLLSTLRLSAPLPPPQRLLGHFDPFSLMLRIKFYTMVEVAEKCARLCVCQSLCFELWFKMWI